MPETLTPEARRDIYKRMDAAYHELIQLGEIVFGSSLPHDKPLTEIHRFILEAMENSDA